MADNQKVRVLKALKERPDGLTTMDLTLMCSTTRPANQIMDLRRDGHIILDNWESGKNKYGEPVRFVRYQLVGEQND